MKKILKTAKHVIDSEILALKKLKASINNSFNQAVKMIVKLSIQKNNFLQCR